MSIGWSRFEEHSRPMHPNQKLSGPLLLCLGVIGIVSLPSGGSGQDWWLEGGPVVRGGMTVKIGGSSYAQQSGLHDPAANGPLTAPVGIGSPGVYGDRIYDNGYVKLDPGTGNRMPPNDPNTTWNWGFTQAGQYNAGAQTLTFQKSGEPGYTSLTDRAVGGSDDLLGGGLQVRGGISLTKSTQWSLDLAAGFQGIWGASTHLSATPYREEVRQIKVTDVYDTSGIGAANFPAGGFQGTYLGPFDHPPVIPSPLLPNLPKSRSSQTSGPLSSAQDNVSLEVDPNLYQFSLGPQLGFAASSRVKLSLRPTVSVNVSDTEVTRNEVFAQSGGGVIGRWSNHGSEQNVLFGLGVSGGVDLDLGKGFYAGVFGGYEWVTQKVDLSSGPNTISYDPSGYVFGAVFGKRF